MSIQTGGVRLCNIITERNVHKYYGKEVKIQLTNNYNVDNYKTHTMLGVAAAIEDHGMTNAFPDDGPYNLNGEFFNPLHNVHNPDPLEPLYMPMTPISNIINGSFTLEQLDMGPEEDEQVYPDVDIDEITNIVKLIDKHNGKIHYLEIPTDLKTFISNVINQTDHIGYYIELHKPGDIDFFTKGHVKRIKNKNDRKAFKELATSRLMRYFPPDLKTYILDTMEVEGKINKGKVNKLGKKSSQSKKQSRKSSKSKKQSKKSSQSKKRSTTST